MERHCLICGAKLQPRKRKYCTECFIKISHHRALEQYHQNRECHKAAERARTRIKAAARQQQNKEKAERASTLSAIAMAARKCGMSYGYYVAMRECKK